MPKAHMAYQACRGSPRLGGRLHPFERTCYDVEEELDPRAAWSTSLRIMELLPDMSW